MSRMPKSSKGRRPRRQFNEEFRSQAVRLVLDEGKSVCRPQTPIPQLLKADLGQKRVLTRFVQKYTLRARLEPSDPHEAVEGYTGDARELGDGGLGNAQIEEAADVVLNSGEHDRRRTTAPVQNGRRNTTTGCCGKGNVSSAPSFPTLLMST